MNAIIAIVLMAVVSACLFIVAIGSIILSIENKRGKKTRADEKSGIPGRSYSDYDPY